jgi:hypothetical protein
MAQGILTRGITLSYRFGEGEVAYIQLTNLQEIPEIGNGAPEKIETTTLADNVKTYIAGLGDSGQELNFKFLYEKDQFQTLLQLNDTCDWKVEMPDGIEATFEGTPAVKFDSASPNNALTYTLTVIVESEIKFA